MGANLVPFTLQKQNAVSATLADLLPAVFSVRLISVEQTSPEAGQNVSTANVVLVVQQDASAMFVGQVRTRLLTVDANMKDGAFGNAFCSLYDATQGAQEWRGTWPPTSLSHPRVS